MTVAFDRQPGAGQRMRGVSSGAANGAARQTVGAVKKVRNGGAGNSFSTL